MVAQHVLTLANSIVGVSVLAMPFCFKQCGVILATLILIMGAVMTRIVCYFLLKGSIMTRRRTYELLAFHAFGPGGKFLVEITIIGFLVGTLIAFLVVMGDLGPELMVDVFSIDNNQQLRTIVMAGLAMFVALPLGLLRNIESLSSVSAASVFFYLFLVVKLFFEALPAIWSGSYIQTISYWRPAGVLQCIPIFSMALSCQTQVLGIYDILPDPSMQKMNEVVKSAVYICTGFYVTVGSLGYIAFCNVDFGGNVLLLFQPDPSSQLIKMCFLLSIAFSFPLVILPCRASLHSLVYKGTPPHHSIDMTTTHIPDSRVKILTVMIVGVTLVMGLIIPNIELVLGLVGSTCGSIICIIFPSVIFIRVTTKSTTERLLAQAVLFLGLIIMVMTTYVTLYAVEKAQQEVEVKRYESGLEEVSKIVSDIPQSLSSSVPPVQFSTAIKDGQTKVKIKEVDVKSGGSGQNGQFVKSGDKPGEVPLPPVEPVLNNPVEEKIPDVKIVPPEKSSPSPPPVESKKDFIPEEFIKKLEEQNIEQKKLIEQQKEILAQFERHHQEDEERKRVEEDKEVKVNKADKSEEDDPGQLKLVREQVVKVEEMEEPKVAKKEKSAKMANVDAVNVANVVQQERVANVAHNDAMRAANVIEQKQNPVEKSVNVDRIDEKVDDKLPPSGENDNNVRKPVKAEKVVKEEKVDVPKAPKAVPQVPVNVVPESPKVVPDIPKFDNIVPENPKVDKIAPQVPEIVNVIPEIPKGDKFVPKIPKFDNVAPQMPQVEKIVPEIPKVKEVPFPEISKVNNSVPEKTQEVYQNIVEKPAISPLNQPVEKLAEAPPPPVVPHAPVVPVKESQPPDIVKKVEEIKVEKKPDREM